MDQEIEKYASELPELVNNHKFLSDLYEHAPLAIAFVDMPSLKYVSANANYCSLLKHHIRPSEIRGKSVFDLLNDPTKAALDAMYRAHEEGVSTRLETVKSENMSHRTTYWTGAIFPFIRQPGHTIIAGMLTEVTERVVAEEQRDTFVRMAAHELRTPLTSLKMRAELLLRGVATVDVMGMKQHLELINQQSTKLNNLISDLLASASISSGKFTLSEKNVVFPDAIKDIIEQHSHLYPNNSIDVQDKIKGISVYVDCDRLSQVIGNLLANAVKHSPPNTAVFVKLSENNTSFLIEITDQGKGIDRTELLKIFEAYYQGKPSDRTGGLGLGLSISQKIIKQMDGRIWAESEGLGRGATFFVELKKKKLCVV